MRASLRVGWSVWAEAGAGLASGTPRRGRGGRACEGLLQTQSVVMGALTNCVLHCSLGWFKRPKQLSIFKVLEVQCHGQVGLFGKSKLELWEGLLSRLLVAHS